MQNDDNFKYRVLTIWQPWATFFVHGIKKIETRPAPTTWTAEKGIYLIHAAQKWTLDQRKICRSEPFYSEIMKLRIPIQITRGIGGSLGFPDWKFPLGCIIGSIEVVECLKIPIDYRINKMFGFILAQAGCTLTEREIEFGDYSHGRYVWLCQNPRIIKEPIPYKNGQGYYQKFKGDVNQLNFI
jgi:hypothetical protein